MTTAAAGPDDLAPALAELEADGRAYVLEYLAAAARANLEVRLALARALAAEARRRPATRELEAPAPRQWVTTLPPASTCGACGWFNGRHRPECTAGWFPGRGGAGSPMRA